MRPAAEFARASCPFVTLLPALVAAWDERPTSSLLLPTSAATPAPADVGALVEQLRGRLSLLPAHACAACEPELADAAQAAGVEFRFALDLVRQAQAATLRRMKTANRETRRQLQDASKRFARQTKPTKEPTP